MNCSCPRGQKLILYVGRAVLLRNRLQAHFFGNRWRDPSPWIEEFESDPHDHRVFVSAWLVGREDLAAAEAVLLDELHPIRCRAGFGFSNPAAWPFRAPDIPFIDPVEIEPIVSRPRDAVKRSGVPNTPAVYAWWIDRTSEELAIKEIAEQILINTWKGAPRYTLCGLGREGRTP
jgi:hypothetical protein